jgi:hypothetical protein
MLVYIFMRSCESLYAFTPSEDGANLPNGQGHGRWERQGTIDLRTGKAADIGLDSEQAIRDIQKNGYHFASVAEMLRRRSQQGAAVASSHGAAVSTTQDGQMLGLPDR